MSTFMILQQTTIGIVIILFVFLSSFSAHSSPARSLAKVARTLSNDIAERASKTKKVLSDKHDVRQLKALSGEELESLKGVHENPFGFFNNQYYLKYKKPIFWKAFLMELKNRPNLMKEIADDWYRQLSSTDYIVYTHQFVESQIAALVRAGVSREEIGHSMLSVAFKRQVSDFSKGAEIFFQQLNEVLDVGTIKNLLADGNFIHQGTIPHTDYGRHLVQFAKEVVLPSQKGKLNFWWGFNQIISHDNSIEIFDQLLLKVWRGLRALKEFHSSEDYQHHVMLPFENILYRRMQKIIKDTTDDFGKAGKNANLEDIETALYHDSNFTIVARAADQDERFSRLVHSIMDTLEWP